jgi:hypothetical protein
MDILRRDMAAKEPKTEKPRGVDPQYPFQQGTTLIDRRTRWVLMQRVPIYQPTKKSDS